MTIRSMLAMATISCMLAIATGAFAAQTGQATSNTTARSLQDQAAASGLNTLKSIETTGDFPSAMCKFASANEASTAQLGQPLNESVVRLDELRQWSRRLGADRLLGSIHTMYYPVLVRGAFRCLVVIDDYPPTKWDTVAFSSGSTIEGEDALRTSLSASTGIPASEFFVVSVKALYAEFVAYRKNGQLFLTPVRDSVEDHLRAGKTLPAKDVFQRLQPRAKRLNADAPG